MSCPDAQILSRYYDEVLAGEERRQIAQHIRSCLACQQVIRLYEGEAQFIQATLQAPHLPAQFVEDVLREVRPPKKYNWLTCLLFFMIALLVLFGGAALVQ